MNLSRNIFDLLSDAWRDMHRTARPAREGKHYAGHRGSPNGRHTLQAARKRQRRARLYARACMSGRKHRYGRP